MDLGGKMIKIESTVECDGCLKIILDFYEIRVTKRSVCGGCDSMPENISCNQLCPECFKKYQSGGKNEKT